jgi:hypothetical protein
VRTEPCACGGEIRAATLKASLDAVAEHNATVCHQVWRAVREQWVTVSPEESTVPVAVRDLSGRTGHPSTSPGRP